MSDIPGPDDLGATRKAAPPPADPALEKTVLAPSGPRGTQDSSLAVTGLPGRRPGIPPTRTFGRYELVDEIARGGMGVVFRARQTDAQRDVALKVLLAGDFASEDDEKRFIREAELAAQLNHPNIVAVHDIGSEAGRRFFTMEIVDGRPLDKWAKGQPLEKQLRVMIKVCRAAHHAHMRGVIHRDLKPGNILVTEQEEPKILDFGLAKAARATDSSVKTVTGQTLGTPFYMAPEQAAGRVHEIDIRTDVWALGVILQEVVSGERPFQGKEILEVLPKIEMEEPVPLKGPTELRLIVGKALEKDRARRYATAEAMAEDLEKFLAGDPVSVRPPGVSRRFRRWARKHPAATGAIVAILAAAGAALGWEFSRPGTIVIEAAPGIAVEIDGRPVQGEARVAAGRHRIAAHREGHEDFAAEISVERGERRTIPVRLARSTGWLDLEADEPGTTVEIDGEIHGLPLRHHAVPTGDGRLTFRRRGCESRERTVTVRRNESSSAWVSLPSARFASVRLGNVFRGPISVRDANLDGVPDVAGQFSQYLITLDGRSGEVLRATVPYREAGFMWWRPIDWDGDGVPDDAVEGAFGDEIRVSVWSGKELGEGGTWRGQKAQKLLWATQFPAKVGGGWWPRPLAHGRSLWIPLPGGFCIARAGDAAPGARIDLPGIPVPALARLGEDAILAGGGTAVSRFDADGRPQWTYTCEKGVTLPASAEGLIDLPGDQPIPCISGDDLVGLSPADGHVVWKHAGVQPRQLRAGETPDGRPLTVYSFLPDGVGAWDIATGRRLFSPAVATSQTSGALTAWATSSWCTVEGTEIVCRSSATGAPLWRFDTRVGTSADPAVAFGSTGAEYAFVTRDHRLLVLGEDGKSRREVLVDFTPQEIHAAALDADGRPDWVLVGYGLQVVRSSRVVWRRGSDNAVRSRPVTFRRNGETAVAQVLRSGDDRVEMQALRGATGEVLWRYGTQFDVMHPPALFDWNGDGVQDVFTQTGAVEPRFVCLSGVDGAELASMRIPGSPYPTAELRDLDGDARPEAILFQYPTLLSARRFGDDKPVWAIENEQPVFNSPLLLDLDGDGKPEIVAAFASVEAGAIGAWSLDGRAVWNVKVAERTWGSPFAHDLDGDGKAEVAVPCGESMVFVGRDGAVLARIPDLGGSSVPGVATPDGGFVIGTKTGVARVRRDGSVAWTWTGAWVTGNLGIAHLPGAPSPAVVGADSAGRVFRIDLDTGRERWRATLGARCEFGVTLEDIDGDGTPEALLGCDDFSLYAIDLR